MTEEKTVTVEVTKSLLVDLFSVLITWHGMHNGLQNVPEVLEGAPERLEAWMDEVARLFGDDAFG